MTSLADIATLIESLSSCAIEENKFAIRLLKLKETDYKAFLKECVDKGFLEGEK